MCYLDTNDKITCSGCEACANVCPHKAICMIPDSEEFRYPKINIDLCTNCGLCRKVCPYNLSPQKCSGMNYTFGGHIKNQKVLSESTSGGAFSAIVDAWCDKNYVIFGAVSDGLNVYHDHIFDKKYLDKFRKSKYIQSNIGTSYTDAKKFLQDGKKVLFSGTPCQIAGLKSFLLNCNQTNLLTVEVICEGVPTPLYLKSYNKYITTKYHSRIKSIDYRYKDFKSYFNHSIGRWDFEVMQLSLKNSRKLKTDRWFNPFWSIWISHLMSRPSCYQCPYATKERFADISLGDLWGVHLYCPELYNHNKGASLVICNSIKGKKAFLSTKDIFIGHELNYEEALKYQGPLKNHINSNPNRASFIQDLKTMPYTALCKKWSSPPTIKLLWQKYVWGNRQKILFWKLTKGFYHIQ